MDTFSYLAAPVSSAEPSSMRTSPPLWPPGRAAVPPAGIAAPPLGALCPMEHDGIMIYGWEQITGATSIMNVQIRRGEDLVYESGV